MSTSPAKIQRMQDLLEKHGITPERYAELDLGIGQRATREETKILLAIIDDYHRRWVAR